MITIKIYKERQYYKSKYGNKEYLDGSSGDDVLLKAAILTGKGLNSEEECVYTAYGETKEEAEKSITNYIKANPKHSMIARTELVESYE